jgi:high-affinity nickel permease
MTDLLAMAAQNSAVSLLAILALGFFLGMRHATDADHVVAVSTIVTRERSVAHAAIIGALWGMGHTLTILVVGAAIILFSFVVSPRLGLTMELSVGLMLVLLGILNLGGFRRSVRQSLPATQEVPPPAPITNIEKSDAGGHLHSCDDAPHNHRSLDLLDRFCGKLSIYQLCRPLLVGIVHGLAGSAAVALLVLTTIQNSRWAVAYLFIFGLGTIAGMMVITIALASAITYTDRRAQWLGGRLAAASGWISLAFGLFIAYQIGICDGLFTGHLHWTPH